MAATDRTNRLGRGGPFALALALVSTAPAFAGQGAAFTCHAMPTQRCHFSVLHADGAREDFVLASGGRREVPDAVPGLDRYMVAVNAAPPANPAACTRATPVGARRSAWCKLSTVGPQGND
jgi:hypothetical protein